MLQESDRCDGSSAQLDTTVEAIDELLTLLAASLVRAPNQRRVFQIAVDELLAPLIALSGHAPSHDPVKPSYAHSPP